MQAVARILLRITSPQAVRPERRTARPRLPGKELRKGRIRRITNSALVDIGRQMHELCKNHATAGPGSSFTLL